MYTQEQESLTTYNLCIGKYINLHIYSKAVNVFFLEAKELIEPNIFFRIP